jgi:hypothetical protein
MCKIGIIVFGRIGARLPEKYYIPENQHLAHTYSIRMYKRIICKICMYAA